MDRLEDFTPLLKTPNQLIEEAKNKGYMFFKQLVPKSKIQFLKTTITKEMKKMEWLDSNFPLDEVRVKKNKYVGESPNDDWVEFYKEVIKLEPLTELAFDANIMNVMNTILSTPVLPHCRKVFRAYSPTKNPYATPPHRDYTWTGGTKNFWTAWLPLTDIDEKLGGLSLVEGSHKLKLIPMQGDERKGWEVPKNSKWLTCRKFEMGDVVFFNGWTLHAGNNNYTKNKIRLSLDFRYQNANDPIRDDSICAHWNEVFGMSWEEIYSNWSKDNPYKYYWKDFKNVTTDTEFSFRQNVRSRFILHKMMKTFKK